MQEDVTYIIVLILEINIFFFSLKPVSTDLLVPQVTFAFCFALIVRFHLSIFSHEEIQVSYTVTIFLSLFVAAHNTSYACECFISLTTTQ